MNPDSLYDILNNMERNQFVSDDFLSFIKSYNTFTNSGWMQNLYYTMHTDMTDLLKKENHDILKVYFKLSEDERTIVLNRAKLGETRTKFLSDVQDIALLSTEPFADIDQITEQWKIIKRKEIAETMKMVAKPILTAMKQLNIFEKYPELDLYLV